MLSSMQWKVKDLARKNKAKQLAKCDDLPIIIIENTIHLFMNIMDK